MIAQTQHTSDPPHIHTENVTCRVGVRRHGGLLNSGPRCCLRNLWSGLQPLILGNARKPGASPRAGMRPRFRRFHIFIGNPVRGPEARLIPAWRNAPGPEVIQLPRAVSPRHSPRQPNRPSRYEAAPAALQIFIGIRFEGRRPDSFQPGATRQVQK